MSSKLEGFTDENIDAGLREARRIIARAEGYHFGGEVVPFDEHFKDLALTALDWIDLDRKRMDWLDEGDNYFLVTPATNMIGVRKGWTHRVGRALESIGERCFDIREAIDKARKAS